MQLLYGGSCMAHSLAVHIQEGASSCLHALNGMVSLMFAIFETLVVNTTPGLFVCHVSSQESLSWMPYLSIACIIVYVIGHAIGPSE